MTQLARLGIFLLYVLLAGSIAVVAPRFRRRATNAFLIYVLAVLLIFAIVGRDAWPLSIFPMMANHPDTISEVSSMIAVRAVDPEGKEWPEDPQQWAPLYPQSIRGWFEIAFPSSSPDDRRAVGEFLLTKAEEARRSRARGAWTGNERLLGPLAAPDTYRYAAPSKISPKPYVKIRVYRLDWNITDPASRRAPRRQLLMEYARP